MAMFLLRTVNGASTPAKRVSMSHVTNTNLTRLCSRCVLIIGIGLRMAHGVTKELGLLWDGIVMIGCGEQYTHHALGLEDCKSKHKSDIRHRPCPLWRFYVSLYSRNRLLVVLMWKIVMQDFRDVEDLEMLDVQSTGLRYTWTQKPKGGHGILKKHDQIMANLDFNDVFMRAHAMFKPYRVSDHNSIRIFLFLDVVKTEWDQYISGFFMFRVVKKLKNLKKPLRKLLYDKGNVHANVNKLRTDLDAIQTALDADPFNVALRERRSYIPQDMVREISNKEVKDAIFSIGDDKSPGPDGFTAAFFKEAWNIIANDVYLAVREFFRNEKEGKIEICECGGGLKCGWNGSETAHPKPQISCCNTEEFTYHSLVIIKEAWMNSSIFGLVPVFPKSIGFILQCSYSCQVSILQILPLEEGIRRLECFNSALMASHIWKLLTLKESLWVKWIHEYKLKGRNFWDFPMRGNMSWGWRKILKLRPIIRKFIWSKIGNGRNTYLWFDTWADFEPLAAQISPRDIVRLSFFSIRRDDARDTLVWRNIHGNVKKFLVSQVWDDIRHRESKVNWYSMVWFPSCIPRHAINLWLIIRRKLKTQDLVPMWDVSDSLGMGQICAGPVAHYTTRNVYVIIQALMPSYEEGTTNRRCVESLLLLAATYYVWKERFGEINSKKVKRSPDQIVECIKSFCASTSLLQTKESPRW
ncbi:reverse transcriptase zinc-binding domain-containing protein [Tanacetum coccineum]